MSDSSFRPLASETSDPFARQLLESARADGSQRGGRDRALLGLGLAPVGLLAAALPPTASGAAGASGSGASAGAAVAGSSKGALLLLGKSLAIGLVGGLTVVGVLDATRGAPARAPAPATSALPAIATPARGPAALAVPESTAAPQIAVPAAALPSLTPPARALAPREVESVPEASSHATTNAAPSSSAARHTDALAQLAALASVRNALAAHQPGRALALLDDFARRFPASQVAEEATVLRIETLGALGRMSEARALGLRFLRDRPASVYASRVRAVTQLAAQNR